MRLNRFDGVALHRRVAVDESLRGASGRNWRTEELDDDGKLVRAQDTGDVVNFVVVLGVEPRV